MIESKKSIAIVEGLIERYPCLLECKDSIMTAYHIICSSYLNGGKLLIAGNGGSAADAEHISGELMKRFKRSRPIEEELREQLLQIDRNRGQHLIETLERPLVAIPLVAHESLTTAFMNDSDSMGVFAQQLLGYGSKGDVFLAISTSGRSENILHAAVLAKAMGISVVSLTGAHTSRLSELSKVCIRVPEIETYLVQELHLPVYHCICMMLEEAFFGQND